MATFLTDKMVFLHLPKTGGLWIADAVKAAGVSTHRPDPRGDQPYSSHGHADLRAVELGEHFSFACVRHPLDWWRSYWGHRMRTGWRADNGLDTAAASEDFNEFIVRALAYRPGYVGDLVEEFVGSPTPKVDFVGRFEHLVDDVCLALRLGGESFSEPALRAHPRRNASDRDLFPAHYRPDVARRLAEAEHSTIERFYAEEPVPSRLLADEPTRGTAPVANSAGRQTLASVTGRLRRAEEHVRSLERALERSRQSEARSDALLQQARAELDHTTKALASLQNSRLVRHSRAVRMAYYRVRTR